MADVLKETDQAKQIEYYHRAQEILAERGNSSVYCGLSNRLGI